MQLVGADVKAQAVEEQPLAGRVNDFIGRDPRRWHADVPTFEHARFAQVYPGVDVIYYGNRQRLEYDFVVAPRADPTQIKLGFAGAQTVRVNRAGELIVGMKGKTLTWRKPTVYQEDKSGKRAVEGRFQLEHSGGRSRVGFALGRYDSRRPLVIDPILIYSTYLGGSGFGGRGSAIAVDSQGAAYVTGYTNSPDFPITPGAFQKSLDSFSTTFVTKLNPTATALIYSTYLGGSGDSSYSDAIAVDSQGNAYVTGNTSSRDFPITPGAFQTTNKSADRFLTAFVTKLNPNGTALIYST
jgi:hypothetical protein